MVNVLFVLVYVRECMYYCGTSSSRVGGAALEKAGFWCQVYSRAVTPAKGSTLPY